MYSEDALTQLQERIATFQHIQLYNHELIDVYLLASHGLVYSDKRATPSAVCSNPNCGLVVEFDSGEDLIKEQLQKVVRDHDQDCEFNQVKGNIVTLRLFRDQGSKIFNQGSTSFRARGVWVQLKPQQVLQALNLKPEKGNQQELNSNIVLQQFMHLDPSISRDSLTKVSSVVFLAVFGWKWLGQTVVGCQFCASRCEVRDFISPSQFSLMKVEEGFCFKSSHKSWCCLVDSPKQFWKQILRQATLMKLQFLPSSFSRSSSELKLRQIQRKSIEIYGKQIKKMNEIRKRLAFKKTELSEKGELSQAIKSQLQKKMYFLQSFGEQQREVAQQFIKTITENHNI